MSYQKGTKFPALAFFSTILGANGALVAKFCSEASTQLTFSNQFCGLVMAYVVQSSGERRHKNNRYHH